MASNKTILITGAARGIGAATAIAATRAGYHVLAVDINSAELEALDDAIVAEAGSATLIPCDLRELELVDQIPLQLASRFESLDALVLNADISSNLQPIAGMDHKIWHQAFDVAVHAHMRLLRGCDPILRASENAHVIAVTSDYANTPTAFWSMNGAAKAALENIVKTYGEETPSVTTHCYNPSRVSTAWLKAAFPGKSDDDTTSADDVASKIIALMT